MLTNASVRQIVKCQSVKLDTRIPDEPKKSGICLTRFSVPLLLKPQEMESEKNRGRLSKPPLVQLSESNCLLMKPTGTDQTSG